jgi:hypothetical protein
VPNLIAAKETQGTQKMKLLALRSLSSFAAKKVFAECDEVGS